MREKPNIAIITAANPRNSGMYSVDLSAARTFSQLGIKHSLFFSQATKKKISNYIPINLYRLKYGEMKFKLLNSIEQLEGFSHIIYWGDFLNNPRYGRGDFSSRDVDLGHSSSDTEAFTRWTEIFSLSEGRPSARVIAIGGNFQHVFDEEEVGILRSFLDRADFVLPRDPRSLENISPLISPRTTLAQGMDCAFLLPTGMSQQIEGKYFCYEFGRSALSDTDPFIRSIENATGLSGIRLPNWLNISARNADCEFWKQRSILSSAQFVITDIYHLSINALHCGAPVYCLGLPSSEQIGTLGDYKKKVLFSMLSLDDHYFETADDGQSAYSSVLNAVQNRAGRGTPEWRARVEEIYEMRESFRAALVAAL